MPRRQRFHNDDSMDNLGGSDLNEPPKSFTAKFEEEHVSKKPHISDLSQQRIPGWQPVLTADWIIVIFAFIGISFLCVGISIISTSNDVVEVIQRYDDLCEGQSTCTVNIEIPKLMSPPIFVYYNLSNVLQGHRQYYSSKSDNQLSGSESDTAGCEPIATSGGKAVVPCGLVANSIFRDVFQARSCGDPNDLATCTDLTGSNWNKKGIAWESDRSEKFSSSVINPNIHTQTSPLIQFAFGENFTLPDTDDEDLMVWMRISNLPVFRKFYRKIESLSLPAGSTLQFEIQNNYDISQFEGEKSIVITTTSFLGGKNEFLGWSYIAVSLLCLLLSITMQIKQTLAPRRLGDMSYFDWN